MTWERFKACHFFDGESGFALDFSRMDYPDDFFARMEPPMASARAAMEELEKGAVANPDENRRVGHYWLRAPERSYR
jgi:glucose-6-phosphate isomerase